MEKELGIKFSKTPIADWNTLLKALDSGECALVSTIAHTTERESYILFTEPYATIPIVIIANNRTSNKVQMKDLRGSQVCAVSGYATEKYLQNKAHVYSFRIKPVANVEEGLYNVAFGQSDFFVEDIAAASYYIKQKGINNLRVAGNTDFNFELCIGISHKYPLLHSAIQKALKRIPENKIKESRAKWIPLDTHVSLSPETLMLIKVSIIFALALLISLVGISILLKRKLKQRLIDLHESEQLFRAIFNLMPYPCAINNSEGRFMMVNKAYRDIIGLTENRIIGKTNEELGIWVDPQARAAISEELKKNGRAENIITRVKQKTKSRDATIQYSAQAIAIKGKQAFVSSLIDITQQKEYQRELEQREKRAIAQRSAISKILLEQTSPSNNINIAQRNLCKIAAETIEVTRTSIWLFSPKNALLVCRILYNSATKEFGQGEMIDPSIIPSYIGAIRNDNRIFVGNTSSDPKTAELYNYYLKPLGINSILDAGIIVEGQMVGLVSFEHVGSPRKWEPDEESFASTIAAIVAQQIENTERKKAEEALKISEERFSKAFKANPAPMIISEIESGRIIDANENSTQLFGYSRDEQINHSSKELHIWEDDTIRNSLVQKIKTQGYLRNEPVKIRTKKGDWIQVLWSVEIITLKGKKVMLSVIVDETERRKSEEALRASEERFSKAFKSNPAPMVISDIDTGSFIDTNLKWDEMIGRERDEQLGRTSKEVGIWKSPNDRDRLIAKLKIQGQLCNEPIEFLKKTGEIIKTLWSVETFMLGNRKVMLSLIVNETERIKTEAALKASEERYRSIIEVSNTGAWEFHADTQHLWCSNKYYEMLGYTSQEFIAGNKMNLKESWINLLHPDDKENVSNHFINYIANGSVGMYENYFRMKHQNGQWIWIWSRGQTLRNPDNTQSLITLGTHINITETKKLEFELLKHKENLEFTVKKRTEELGATLEELQATNDELSRQREDLEQALSKLKTAQEQAIQTEKMASLGILTAGIAHEINNPINYILNGTLAIEGYVAENIPSHTEKLKPLLDAINTGITRTTNIVRSLNRFSRKDTEKLTPCNLHEVIDNCLTILHNQYKDRIAIRKEYTEKQFEIIANEGTLHQAILNILTNAIQAIENLGTITIKTTNQNNSVELSITDTGNGIEPDLIKHIYDPFFTTKDPGKGTGLGLSITRRIIEEHNGSIKCQSIPKEGTEFIITLPLNP